MTPSPYKGFQVTTLYHKLGTPWKICPYLNDIEGSMLTMSEIDFIKSKISLYVLYALFDFDTVCVTQCLLL